MKDLEIWMFPYILLGTLLFFLILLIVENYTEKFSFGKFIVNKPKKSHKLEIIWVFCQLRANIKVFIWLIKYPLWFLPRNKI